MEIELEKTFLLKQIPSGLENCQSVEVFDIYIPQSAPHPVLRIRKKGDIYEMTKKEPLIGTDSSEQGEQTISLSKEEFSELALLKGKRLRKIRYFYPLKNNVAEIDIFLDDLKGLALVDFEFNSSEEKEKFVMPDFCLADVTQDKFIAGGWLAGRRYSDINPFLIEHNYKKFVFLSF